MSVSSSWRSSFLRYGPRGRERGCPFKNYEWVSTPNRAIVVAPTCYLYDVAPRCSVTTAEAGVRSCPSASGEFRLAASPQISSKGATAVAGRFSASRKQLRPTWLGAGTYVVCKAFPQE